MAHYILFRDNVFASGACNSMQATALESDPSVVAVFKNYDQTERFFLPQLMCILFALTVNMNAGVDNYVYVDAIESIQHLLQ